MSKVVEACRGFQTGTGVWLASQGAVRSGPEYVTRALVGMLHGHCDLPIEQCELAVKLEWSKVGGIISLPRIQSSFWPGEVTEMGIALEFGRIIEEFIKELKASK